MRGVRRTGRRSAAVGVAIAAVLAGAAACAGARRGPEREAPTGRVAAGVQEGLASFYSGAHHGKRTASGERFDMRAMTCAHRTAPFGTRLRVVDVETGRSVVVRVNDRGPYAKGRVVDLSLAAAQALGIVERGVARVRIERLD
jgi:rare lipoprotein A